MARNDLTAARVRELFAYDPDSGKLIRRNSGLNYRAGDEPGYENRLGYRMIAIDGFNYLTHRVIWLIVRGSWPVGDIDHIDGEPRNNSLSNLRDVTRRMNMENQRRSHSGNVSSGLLGVRKNGLSKKNPWRADVGVNGKMVYVGAFPTAQEAHVAYIAAKRRLHAGCTI